MMNSILHADLVGNVCAIKHEVENFGPGDVIVVSESQYAILVANGEVVNAFGPGKHELTSEDISDYDAITKLYFVSSIDKKGAKWGTDSKVRVEDPFSGMIVDLGACGTFDYKIVYPTTFLTQIIGLGSVTTRGVTFDEVTSLVKPKVMSIVKAYLAKVIKERGICVLDLNDHYVEISEDLLAIVNFEAPNFGIELSDFIISRIMTPDDDPNFKRMKEQFGERYLRVNQAAIDTEVLNAEHDKVMAKTRNEVDAELYRQQIIEQARKEQEAAKNNTDNWVCPNCKESNPGKAKFCCNCGTKKPETWTCPKCGNKGITTKFCPECGCSKADFDALTK